MENRINKVLRENLPELPEGFAGLGVSLCWSVPSLRPGFLPGRRRRA